MELFFDRQSKQKIFLMKFVRVPTVQQYSCCQVHAVKNNESTSIKQSLETKVVAKAVALHLKSVCDILHSFLRI